MVRFICFTILLTIPFITFASGTPDAKSGAGAGVTVMLTCDYTHTSHLRSPSINYLSKASTYIKAIRDEVPAGEKFILLDIPTDDLIYPLHNIVSFYAAIREYMQYDSWNSLKVTKERLSIDKKNLFFRDTVFSIRDITPGIFVTVIKADASGKVSFKRVSTSLFPDDREFNNYMAPERAKSMAYMNDTLAILPVRASFYDELYGSSVFGVIFNTFQLEVSRADISIFSPILISREVSEAGPFTRRDLISKMPSSSQLCVYTTKLRGYDVKLILEDIYSRRYNRMHSPQDDLVKLHTDIYGTPYPYGIVGLESVGGINYTVNVSHEEGRRVRILSMGDGSRFAPEKVYTVVLSGNASSGSVNRVSKVLKKHYPEMEMVVTTLMLYDFRIAFCEWLKKQEKISVPSPGNWKIVPESWVKTQERIVK